MATLEVRIKEALLQIGTDWKAIWSRIGSGSLTTSSQNLVGAINEVKTTADTAMAGTAPDASTTVKGIIEIATNTEATTGTDTVRAVTPAGVKAVVDARWVTADQATAGVAETASDAEALAMSAADKIITPLNLAYIRGANNGIAGLDGSGKVPSSQLPSFVDDVLEGSSTAAFPATGATGVMYVALDTNKVYRWGGSAYTEISGSPGSTDAVPEGSTNLYYTAARADTRADGRITALVGNTNVDLAAYYATAKA